MKNIILRPLALFCITFFVTLCAMTAVSGTVKAVVAAIFAAVSAVFVVLTRKEKNDRKKHRTLFALCFFAAAVCLSAVLSFYSTEIKVKNVEKYSGESGECICTVTDVVWDGGYSGTYIARVEKIDEKAEYFGILLSTDGGIPVGERLQIKCLFSSLDESAAASDNRYYLAKGVLLRAESESAPAHADGYGNVFSAIQSAAGRLNQKLTAVLISSLGTEDGGFAAALLVGNRSQLTDSISRDFRTLGISHLLALSGLHLSVLCAAVSLALRRVFGKKAEYAGIAAVVLLYMLMTGFSPSVTRAGIMLLISVALSAAGIGSDSYTGLGIAVVVICLADPLSAYDIGLQLSFAATFAVIMYSRRALSGKRKLTEENIKREKTKKSLPALLSSKVLSAMLMTAIVVLFTIPLSCMYFGSTSVVSVVTSVAYSFLITVILWLLPFVIIFAPAPTFSAAASFVCEKLISIAISSVSRIASIPGMSISLKYPFADAVCITLFVLVVMLCVSRKKRITALVGTSIVAFIAAFAVAASLYTAAQPVRIIPVNTGKSDCAVVTSSQGTMLVDVSDGYTKALRIGAQEAFDRCYTEIDSIMLTHLHNRYVTTLPSLLDKYRVHELIIPDDPEFTDAADAIKAVAKRYHVPVIYFTPGETVSRCGVSVTTYAFSYLKRSTQPVIRFDISPDDGGKCFAYLGASFFEAFPDVQPETDFLWLGAHGPIYKKDMPVISGTEEIIATGDAKSYLSDGNDAATGLVAELCD